MFSSYCGHCRSTFHVNSVLLLTQNLHAMGKSKRKVKSKGQQSASAVTNGQLEVLFNQALDLHKTGDLRAAADKYMEAVLAAPSKWKKHRCFAFRSFIQIVLYDIKLCTKNDIKLFKKRFVENEEEPVVYRAAACQQIAAFYVFKEKHFIKATDKYKQALELITESPLEDDNKLLCFPPFTPSDGANTVKQQLDKLKSGLKQALDELKGDPPTQEEAEELRELHSILCGPNAFDVSTLEGKSALNRYMSLRFKHHMAGGSHCDCCQKVESELEERFMKCSICKLTLYCSKECQTKQWKAGHKKACRKRGQIKQRDIMVIIGVEGREDLDYRFVRICEPVVCRSEGDLCQVELLAKHDGKFVLTVTALLSSRLRLRQ
jgi:hypothetical protein